MRTQPDSKRRTRRKVAFVMITAFVMIVVARFKGTRIEIRDLTAAIIADQERDIVELKAWRESF
jgi:uncharacterized protein (DUF305 family)